MNQEQNNNISTLVTVLLLIFVFPLGLIVMWIWPKWARKTKLLVTLLPLLVFGGLTLIALMLTAAINPQERMQEANCRQQCSEQNNLTNACVEACVLKGE